jgi:hypothetical protein
VGGCGAPKNSPPGPVLTSKGRECERADSNLIPVPTADSGWIGLYLFVLDFRPKFRKQAVGEFVGGCGAPKNSPLRLHHGELRCVSESRLSQSSAPTADFTGPTYFFVVVSVSDLNFGGMQLNGV